MNNDSSAFNIWAKDEGYWIEDSISAFSQVTDAKVAFDAEDYLNSFLTGGHATYEPLVPALGGIPFTLNSHIDTLLSELQNAGIKPLFIFPGGRAMSRDRITTSRYSKIEAISITITHSRHGARRYGRHLNERTTTNFWARPVQPTKARRRYWLRLSSYAWTCLTTARYSPTRHTTRVSQEGPTPTAPMSTSSVELPVWSTSAARQ
ncbi:uncharacterized protein K489DRAFT_5094 [Dissoconium aciculare CBS 342.82]|uniref:XPG N-terminal domain-containing protein n=1 Tax=Dissoconium aciculare CBS 342.82 TaxID=1314786 RepID=A0A6J3MGH0_9PEZI|nr:uncharacterized protein K489DRAFT_5094 [Dissoconium aciculare CBS 342.82]KAF1827050.1 hypothetical protein K489DRAFT_5094 [Dissoconium aciculare CBS 342.82]